jgi:ribosome biogenesis GTPase
MILRLGDGSQVDARIKGKKLQPVCGDRVRAEPIANEPEWLITSIESRQNELSRPDNRGRREVLAANLSCIVVMAAPEPDADWYIVDRYLAAAENIGARGVVVYNKTDISRPADSTLSVLEDYASHGYPVVECSAESGENLDRLAGELVGEMAIIAGQSGVGKSTVINQLAGDSGQRTGGLSNATGEGRHTTVNSVMINLPGGGAVIDSPGVRDYAPAIESADAVARGFREISDAGQHCRFANCSHLREPDCAVKKAVEDGEITSRRYDSYKRLMNITKDYSDKKN